MMYYLIQFLTYALPVTAVVLFVVSLVRYIRARRANQSSFKTKLDAFFVYSGLIWEF